MAYIKFYKTQSDFKKKNFYRFCSACQFDFQTDTKKGTFRINPDGRSIDFSGKVIFKKWLNKIFISVIEE